MVESTEEVKKRGARGGLHCANAFHRDDKRGGLLCTFDTDFFFAELPVLCCCWCCRCWLFCVHLHSAPNNNGLCCWPLCTFVSCQPTGVERSGVELKFTTNERKNQPICIWVPSSSSSRIPRRVAESWLSPHLCHRLCWPSMARCLMYCALLPTKRVPLWSDFEWLFSICWPFFLQHPCAVQPLEA